MVFARVLFVVLALGTFTSCSCSHNANVSKSALPSSTSQQPAVTLYSETNPADITMKNSASLHTTPSSSNTKATTVSFLSTSESSASDSTNKTVSQNHVNVANFNYNDLPNFVLQQLHDSQLEKYSPALDATTQTLNQNNVNEANFHDYNLPNSVLEQLHNSKLENERLKRDAKKSNFQSSTRNIEVKPLQSSLPSGAIVKFDPTRTDYSVKVVSNVSHSPTDTFVSSVVQPAKPSQQQTISTTSQSPSSSSINAGSLNSQASGSTVSTMTHSKSQVNSNVTVISGNGSFNVPTKQLFPICNSTDGSVPQTLGSGVFSKTTTSSTTKTNYTKPSTTIRTAGPAVSTHSASVSENQQSRSPIVKFSPVELLSLSSGDDESTISLDTVVQSKALTGVTPTSLTSTPSLHDANTQHHVSHSLSGHQSSVLTAMPSNFNTKFGDSNGNPNFNDGFFDDGFDSFPPETQNSNTISNTQSNSFNLFNSMPRLDSDNILQSTSDNLMGSADSNLSSLRTATASVGANGDGLDGPNSCKREAIVEGDNKERREPVSPVDPLPSTSQLGALVAAVIVVAVLCACLLGLVYYRRTNQPAEQGDVETGQVDAGKPAAESKSDSTVVESPKQP